jgi:uncharacterized protein with HEPN domain
MSKHDDLVSLKDMLSHSREAIELLSNTKRHELCKNRVLQLALTRLIEIIGEAGRRISKQTQSKYPAIPWPEIIGMRN